ncbi:hypothetical protein MPTK1_7g15540 [Marchantia polymorpha subsp. ruderalis]|nr:hypothetical protein MARPO_0009s0238 [Marchantia polymorpha]PTQ47192.1 hypothetical protein MARPO_0009s0238 [Marchantia polymorpha]BBN17585.1 hypothetical protein Mp_7g15540 [Marchantia polymorpha subsp. ruderalis]BBN17586.1 hypothetical protein Mp_7g15540 [Marchantia polymorpha subsp. ruderalis]|eukprot:PTQ47191.1 hypothetical protein MARPO_0009s0238 [Marchantia polymorpha]
MKGWRSWITILAMVAVLIVQVQECESFRSTPAVSILSDTGSDVKVRCQSGDDDLGTRNLKHGHLWHWEITPNIKGTTLFFCSFWWWNEDKGQVMHAMFPVWSMNVVKRYRFDPAAWKVEKDGFWFYKPRWSKWEKRHDWNTKL